MSYLVDNSEYGEDSEKKTRQEKQGVQTTSGAVDGSHVGQPAGGGAVKAAPGSSGQFTNIQQYIESNKPKVHKLQKDIADRFRQTGQQLEKDITAERQRSLGADSQLEQERQRLSGGEQFIGSQLQDPSKSTQEDIQRFQTYQKGYTPIYQAPDLSQERRSLEKLGEEAKALYTRKGKMGALSDIAKGNDYTAGEQTLDRALITGTASPYLTRQTLQPSVESRRQQLAIVEGSIGEQREANIAAIAALQRQAQEGVQAAQTQIEQDIASRKAEEEARLAQERLTLQEKLNAGMPLTEEDIRTAGIEDTERFRSLYEGSLPYKIQQAIREGRGGEKEFLGYTLDAPSYYDKSWAGDFYVDPDKPIFAADYKGDVDPSRTALRESKGITGKFIDPNDIGSFRVGMNVPLREIYSPKTFEERLAQLSPEQLDLGRYLQDAPELTAAMTSTPEQYQRALALSRLAGTQSPLLEANMERAGTSESLSPKIDYALLEEALRASEYIPEYATTKGVSYQAPEYIPVE
jgi:hypothetical protein